MSTRKEIAVLAPVRTPIGRFGGGLSSLSAVELGAAAARGTLARSKVDPASVDLVIFGNGRQAGGGPNPARQIVPRAGLPHAVPAWTVNQACASGIRSILDAHNAILLGDAEIVLAGGTESMSRVPYFLDRVRFGHRMGDMAVVDGMYRDGFLCPLSSMKMGETAEVVADRYGITRTDQDQYAAETQQRCQHALAAGAFQSEIVPVEVTTRSGAHTMTEDEHPRAGVTAGSLARLPPVFRKGGTVHAGNSSGITDGAAACIVLPVEQARALGTGPAARIVGHATVGVEPEIMGIGPVPAVRSLLAKTGVTLEEIDLIELNEAFAAQALACIRELELDPSRLNVNGGAIALGHPIGCTGTRIVTTLMHEMERRSARLGMATLCVSGGMGLAILLGEALMTEFKGVDFLSLDAELTDEERLIRDTVRAFVSEQVMPGIASNNREGRFPHELVAPMGELGLLGANLEGYGCAGLGPVAYGLIMQELERGDSGIRSFVSVQGALCMYPIYAFGSEAQRDRWLPAMARGEAIGCFGLTEPDHGSDPGGMETRAERDGDGWVLNGNKAWITNGSIADVAVVWARTPDGVRGFLVEKGTPGLSAPDVEGKFSLRASVTSELVLQDVKIPGENLLPGTEGLKSALACLTQARYGIAWGAIGSAMAVYDEAVRYAGQRIQFGKPIAGFQIQQQRLVWMLNEITKGQLMNLRVGRMKERKEAKFFHVSMAKRNNCWVAREVARLGREILGANGIMDEYQAFRHMANIESVYTYEGTHDIHTLILGEQITGIPAYS